MMKAQELPYSDLVLDRMNVDARAEEGNYYE
jgi:hypothetical protein